MVTGGFVWLYKELSSSFQWRVGPSELSNMNSNGTGGSQEVEVHHDLQEYRKVPLRLKCMLALWSVVQDESEQEDGRPGSQVFPPT